MSNAFACHYRKNTPGYLNPWESCKDEILNTLECSDSVYGKPLNIFYSGYTSGVPLAYRALPAAVYAGSRIIYEIRITTGDNPYVNCSGAAVQMDLYLNQSVNSGMLVLSSGFTVDKNGYASGSFSMPTITGTQSSYEATIFAVSGVYTGLLSVSQTVDAFPEPSFTATFSTTTNEANIGLTNNDYLLPVSGFLEKSSDYGATFSTASSWTIAPGESVSYTDDLAMDWRVYKAYLIVSGFEKAITAAVTMYDENGVATGRYPVEYSGGHPAPALGMVWRWYYNVGDSPSSAHAYIEIDVESGKSGAYLDGQSFNSQYSGNGKDYWTDFSDQATFTINPFGVIFPTSFFMQKCTDIETEGAGDFYIQTSGKRQNPDDGGYFYSTAIKDGPFSISDIKIWATSAISNTGCGIDVWWEGINLGIGGYQLDYSGSGLPLDTGVVFPDWFGYRFDTLSNCGRPYFFKASRVSNPSISSVWVSASGSLILAAPAFTLQAVNINPGNPERPTTQHYVYIDWSSPTFRDPRAEYISGTRTHFLSPSVDGNIMLRYADAVGATDSQIMPLSSEHSFVSYTFQLVTGINLANPIFGDFVMRDVEIGRTPITPTLLGAVKAGYDVTASWTGKAFEEPIYESYVLHRLNTSTNEEVSIACGYETYSYLDEGLPAGNYSYFVETISTPPLSPNFKAVSNFSNSISVTIP